MRKRDERWLAMQRQPWFSRMVLDCADTRVLDELVAPNSTIVQWIRVGSTMPGSPGQVLLVADPKGADRILLEALLILASRPSWPTVHGGLVQWIFAKPPRDLQLDGLVTTTASNNVARARIDGRDCVLKAYRILGSDRGEAELTAELSGQPLLPDCIGWLSYTGPAWPNGASIALLTATVSGVSLDVPLRAALHGEWTNRPASAALPVLLRAVKIAVTALHRLLAAERPSIRVPLGNRRPSIVAQLAAVRRTIRSAAQGSLLDRLAALADRLMRDADYPVGPCHGDLHLAHVLVDVDADHPIGVSFIDLDQSDPVTASPLDDFAALRRAVECFIADEDVARQARFLGIDRHELATRRRAAALTGTVPTPSLASQWGSAVVRALTTPTGADEAGAEVAYVCRLLHELRHHGERSGDAEADYYVDLTWVNLAEFLVGKEKP